MAQRGPTNLTGIAELLQSKGAEVDPLLFRLALALLVAGLSFRITAVPFHFYAPDVFQGVAISNAAMLSFIPKVVGLVALVRLIPLTGSTGSPGLWLPDASARTLLAILATVTMFLGNLMALRQKNLQRLLAYSSVAHAGYMLVGLAAGNVGAIGGTSAVLFYLATYGLMTVGVFALLRGTDNGDHPVVNRDDLRGLSRAAVEFVADIGVLAKSHRSAADGRFFGEAELVSGCVDRGDANGSCAQRSCS